MWICPTCGEKIPDHKDSCAFCHTKKQIHTNNWCLNPKCPDYKVELNDMGKVCSTCGELTSIGKKIQDMI